MEIRTNRNITAAVEILTTIHCMEEKHPEIALSLDK
jgi:hypothetical protein